MASPYSTGGGGTVLEHCYGAVLLSHLLLGDPLGELGDDVVPVSVRFQDRAFSPVDDLIVVGTTPNGGERRVSIGVRRAPKVTASDTATAELLASYLRVVVEHSDAVRAGQWRLALAVASPNPAMRQVRELAVVARSQPNEAAFRNAVAQPGRVAKSTQDRLGHLDALVARAAEMTQTTVAQPDELVWCLLHALWIRELRLEEGDDSDQAAVIGRLRSIVPGNDVTRAKAVYSALEKLSHGFAPSAATVTREMLWQRLSGLVADQSSAVTLSSSSAGITSVSLAVPTHRPGHHTRGRTELTSAVLDLVRAGRNKVVVLHGAGGHGKTTIAIDVAGATDRLVWWVDAGSEARLVQGMQALAVASGASPVRVQQAWHDGTGSAPDLLWEALDSRVDEWLVVLDNADDIDLLAAGHGRLNQYRGWLRKPRNCGSVIVTSRHGHPQAWGDAVMVEVGPLSSKEGGQVLLDRLPEAGTRAEAETLAARLGGLPLALWLAAGYLAAARTVPDLPGLVAHTTFTSYLKTWEACFVDVSDLSWDTGPHDERELLEKTWELSLDLLERRGHPVARPLLRVLACLAPGPVPTRLVDAGPLSQSPLFEGVDARKLGNAMRALVDVGLLDLDAPGAVSSLAIHPVVHDANRFHAERDTAYRRAALTLVTSAAHGSNVLNTGEWPFLHILLPHGQVATDVTQDASENADVRLSSAEVCHILAIFCEQNGLDHKAFDLYSTALDCRRELIGPIAEPTLASQNNRANALRRLGRFSEAAAEYREVLAAETVERGEDRVQTLMTRSALASLLCDSGELREAKREARAMMDIMARADSEYESALIPAALALGRSLCELGELDESERILRDELAHARTAYGAHPYTLEVMSALHEVLRSRGENGERAELAEALIRMATAVFGPEHDQTFTARTHRAVVMLESGLAAQAEEELHEILARLRRIKGDQHPQIIEIRRSLVFAMRANGKISTAEIELRSLLNDEQTVFGEGRGTDQTRIALAEFLEDHGEYAEAERIYRNILRVRSRQKASGQLDLMVRTGLAQCLLNGGNPDEAEDECRTALRHATKLLNREDSTVALVYNLLAGCYQARNEITEALEALDRAISIQSAVQGADKLSVLTARANRAVLLQAHGLPQEAFVELALVCQTGMRAGYMDHPAMLGIGYNLAMTARDSGNMTKAIKVLRIALARAVDALGHAHTVTSRLHYGLGMVLADLNEDDEALEHLNVVLDAIDAGRVGDPRMIRGTRSTLASIKSRQQSR